MDENFYIKVDGKFEKISGMIDIAEVIRKKQEEEHLRKIKYIDARLLDIQSQGGQPLHFLERKSEGTFSVVYIDNNGKTQEEILFRNVELVPKCKEDK